MCKILMFTAISWFVACSGEYDMETADGVFHAALNERQIQYTLTDEGLYNVSLNDKTVTVSLANLRRNFDRDRDPGAIEEFVKKLSADFIWETPRWDVVRPYVRYSLEPNDYESGFEDVLFSPVTSELNQVFVYTPPDGSRISWINETTLADWRMNRDDVIEQAEANMSELIRQTKLEILEMDGYKLGMLSTEETPFKASLIISPSFRELVLESFGWPVYVIVPCRDFAYILSADDKEFLGRLGSVVIKEYLGSGHSITKDVLEVSSEGIKAIGTYSEPSESA